MSYQKDVELTTIPKISIPPPITPAKKFNPPTPKRAPVINDPLSVKGAASFTGYSATSIPSSPPMSTPFPISSVPSSFTMGASSPTPATSSSPVAASSEDVSFSSFTAVMNNASIPIKTAISGISFQEQGETCGNGSLIPCNDSSPLPIINTPLPQPSTIEVRNYQGLIKETSVEQILLKSGYAALEKIIVRHPDGSMEAKYYKTFNKLGQIVFVYLDTEGHVAMLPTDVVMIEGSSGTTIPLSIKMGSYECSGLDVCGVAFLCSDGICVLDRENQGGMAPRESSYVFLDKGSEKIVIEDLAISYPVVKMSEIKANPEQVLRNTDQVTKRIRANLMKISQEGMKKLESSVGNLYENCKKYGEIFTRYSVQLSATIRQLEGYAHQYDKESGAGDINKAKQDKVLYNLRRRNEMAIDLFKSSSQVESQLINVIATNNLLNEMNKFLNEQERIVNTILESE